MSDLAANHGTNPHPLDAPVWSALTGRQQRFALGNRSIVRFQPDVAPFAAMSDTTSAAFDILYEMAVEYGPPALATTMPVCAPARFSVLRQATLVQMVCKHMPDPVSLEPVKLGRADVPDMLALTEATQPGPFGPRTVELGDYFGIREQGRLVAMAGERMSIEGYTEISAVCVDDAFRSQGLATGLMTLLMTRIKARGDTPFLHVLTSNERAIAVYRSLGFVERRQLFLTVLGAAQGK